MADGRPPEKDAKQRTLFDLQKASPAVVLERVEGALSAAQGGLGAGPTACQLLQRACCRPGPACAVGLLQAAAAAAAAAITVGTSLGAAQVVRLDTSAVCFSAGAVSELKKTLVDPSSPKWLLLQTLRKLDCFRWGGSALWPPPVQEHDRAPSLCSATTQCMRPCAAPACPLTAPPGALAPARFEFGDLVSTEVGVAVSTLQQHPKLEVAKLAHSLQNKWRALVEDVLFKRLPYDAELASTIPEDPPAPPPPPPEEAQQQAADRAAQLEARRQQELDFLLSESESEEGGSGRDSDPDFRPGGRSGGSSKGKLRSKRKQKG